MKQELDKTTIVSKKSSTKKDNKSKDEKQSNMRNSRKLFNTKRNNILYSYEFYPTTHILEIVESSDGTVIKNRYPFHVADKKEIQKIRFQLLPAVILKQENVFYVAYLPKDTEIVPNQMLHKYDHACNFCNRCSAASDQKGGCIKVRNMHWKTNAKSYGLFNQVLTQKNFPSIEQFEAYKEERKKDFIKSILESCRIEKYNFIDFAVEGINLKRDFFFIIECNHLIPLPKYNETQASELENFSKYVKVDY